MKLQQMHIIQKYGEKQVKKQLKELKVVASWEWDRGMRKGQFYFAISLVALFF